MGPRLTRHRAGDGLGVAGHGDVVVARLAPEQAVSQRAAHQPRRRAGHAGRDAHGIAVGSDARAHGTGSPSEWYSRVTRLEIPQTTS